MVALAEIAASPTPRVPVLSCPLTPTIAALALEDAEPHAGRLSQAIGACSGKQGGVLIGSYVDEVVAYTQTVAGVTKRYYPHYNHLYSVAALTDGATGAVVERFTYDAYGKQKITDASGNVTRSKSAVGWDRGFTGYVADNETGLLHARARQYSPTMGRFVGRDPIGYVNGASLYNAYFVPNRLDWRGLFQCEMELIVWIYMPTEDNGDVDMFQFGLWAWGSWDEPGNLPLYPPHHDVETSFSANGIVQKIAEAVGDCCLKKLTIWQHGTNGSIALGQDDLGSKWSKPAINGLSLLMCDETSTVTFVQCMTEEEDYWKRARLVKELAIEMGVQVAAPGGYTWGLHSFNDWWHSNGDGQEIITPSLRF